MLVFSTLFNVNYIDKAIVMIESLKRVCDDFKLYAFAFDDECYKILSTMDDDKCIPVSLEEFETKELLEAKSNRTMQEYCWTCSCHTIKHVLEKCHEPHCTYIDVDMFFYSSPQCLINEILENNCDVGIIEHRMPNNKENRRAIDLSGIYCIEFNTFFNNSNGLKILKWWCDRCIECCTVIPDEIHFGDQKYLNDWTDRFEGVHVLTNPGAGIAPWNMAKYRSGSRNNYVRFRFSKSEFPIVFYHFQAIKYLSKNLVDIGVHMYPNKSDVNMCSNLYREYLNKIECARLMLKEDYGIDIETRNGYVDKFSRKKYFREDLSGERNPYIFITKMWRIFVRKKNDYIIYK